MSDVDTSCRACSCKEYTSGSDNKCSCGHSSQRHGN